MGLGCHRGNDGISVQANLLQTSGWPIEGAHMDAE